MIATMAKKRVVTQEDYDKANEAYRGDLWNQDAEVAKIATTVSSSDLAGLSEILKKHIDAEWLRSRSPKSHLSWTRKSLREIQEAALRLRQLLAETDPRTADELTGIPGFGSELLKNDYYPDIKKLTDDADQALEKLRDASGGQPSETLYKLAAVDLAFAYEEFTGTPYTWSGGYEVGKKAEAQHPPGRKFVEAGLRTIWPKMGKQKPGTASEHASRIINANR